MKLSLASGNVYIRETLYQNKKTSRKYAKRQEKIYQVWKRNQKSWQVRPMRSRVAATVHNEVGHVHQPRPLPSTLEAPDYSVPQWHRWYPRQRDSGKLQFATKKSGHNWAKWLNQDISQRWLHTPISKKDKQEDTQFKGLCLQISK